MNLVTTITAIITSGTAAAYATELLKLPFIAIPATKYPRITAAVASLIASVVALVVAGVTLNVTPDPIVITGTIAGAFILASYVYQLIIKENTSGTQR